MSDKNTSNTQPFRMPFIKVLGRGNTEESVESKDRNYAKAFEGASKADLTSQRHACQLPFEWSFVGHPYVKLSDRLETALDLHRKNSKNMSSNDKELERDFGSSFNNTLIDRLYQTVFLNYFPNHLIFFNFKSGVTDDTIWITYGKWNLTINVKTGELDISGNHLSRYVSNDEFLRDVAALRAVGDKIVTKLNESPALLTDLLTLRQWLKDNRIERAIMFDIGVFSSKLIGLNAVLNGFPLPPSLPKSLPSAKFEWRHKRMLNPMQCELLMQAIDDFDKIDPSPSNDVQRVWTQHELEDAICMDLPDEVKGMTIKTRRVKASPEQSQGIDFHRDVSKKTISVALNNSAQYQGGDMVYIDHEDRPTMIVPRMAGDVLIHDNTISHGVTALFKGTRYHLFFLQEK